MYTNNPIPGKQRNRRDKSIDKPCASHKIETNYARVTNKIIRCMQSCLVSPYIRCSSQNHQVHICCLDSATGVNGHCINEN